MSGIFKAYDIRGVYPTDLNAAMAEKIGMAYAVFTGAKKVVVGRDMRPHSVDMFEGLAAGLVKMYAMVNVSQYQIVATGYTVEECQENYAVMLLKSGLTTPEAEPFTETNEVTGRIAEIRSSVMSGDTYYFIRLQDEAAYYLINGREYPIATILNVEDKITVVYEIGEEEILTGISIERK